jgi:hypothetical protein
LTALNGGGNRGVFHILSGFLQLRLSGDGDLTNISCCWMLPVDIRRLQAAASAHRSPPLKLSGATHRISGITSLATGKRGDYTEPVFD